MTELNDYQKIIAKLNLTENEESSKIFQYVIKEYPECTEESCQKLLGMLALVLPNLDYDSLVTELFPNNDENPTRRERFVNFMKSLIKKDCQ